MNSNPANTSAMLTLANRSNQAARRRFSAQLLGLSALAVSGAALAQTTPTATTPRAVPAELAVFGSSAAPWGLQGSGALRFLGFKAYDAYLWRVGAVANPLRSKSQFALEIDYKTAIKGEEIVNVSLVEMTRLRRLSDAQIRSWTAEMKRTFPNVQAGDRLTGVYLPQLGTRFFYNAKPISEFSDPAFGDAFFAIWLDEKAKRTDLRSSLLGIAAPPVANPSSYGPN